MKIMKRKGWIFFGFLTVLFSCLTETVLSQEISAASVPSSFNVPRGQSSLSSVVYQFTSSPPATISLSSASGSFLAGAKVIEVNPVRLIVNLQNGSGRVSEVIQIPVRVLERTLQSGTNRFTYSRTFVAIGNITGQTTVSFAITTDSGATFGIKRMALYFGNQRGEITIERNFPHLKAFAEISFVGSGLFRGYWEVDGRVLAYENRHITQGQTINLETPVTPPLPTLDTGSHIVRFVITNPATEIPLPSILYFVTPREFKALPIEITLKSPRDESLLEYSPTRWEWERLTQKVLFLIQFFEHPDSQPVFSAYTREPFYSMPEPILRSMFSPGRKYYWKVKGFDDENNILSESRTWSFSFKIPEGYVPGQIITAFSEDPSSRDVLEDIRRKHRLTVIDTFALQSIKLRVALFGTTEKEIFKVIDELKKDPRILIAQPNFVSGTLSDPLRNMQYVHDLFKIDKVHAHFKGRGIRIALVDTGVDASHRDLKDRLIFTKNFIRGRKYEGEIHGTATAGVIAASVNGFGIEGVAPNAELLAMRACQQGTQKDSEGECFTESLSRALDEAIEHKVSIVNMGFGGRHRDPLLTRLIDKGVERGILFVAAAGNSLKEKDLRFPASYPPVISVAGVDERLRPFPNPDVARKVSVCAPAVNILSTVPNQGHKFLSGTSLSSAQISGLLALALEKKEGLSKQTLPEYKGNPCKWLEDLLKIPICEK